MACDPPLLKALGQYLEDLTLLEAMDGYAPDARGHTLSLAGMWRMVCSLMFRLSHFWTTSGGQRVVLLSDVIYLNMNPGANRMRSRNNTWLSELRRWESQPEVETVLVFTIVSPPPGPNNDPHATVLVFDLPTRTRTLYDPNGNVADKCGDPESLCCFATALPPALLAGYTGACHGALYPGLELMMGFRSGEGSVAGGAVDNGLCTSVTTLVAVCCLRLQYPSPFNVDLGLCRQFKWHVPGPQREVFRRNLVRWSKKLMQKGTWEDIEERLGLRDPIDEVDRRCLVYTKRTKQPCQRRACDRHGLCWQHRHALLLGARGCKRPVSWDPPTGPWCTNPDCTAME